MAALPKPPLQKSATEVSLYAAASPQSLHLRDGELIVFRRSHSHLYQCRYKLADGTWHRQSTRKASIEQAIAAACNIYDEARFRQRLGLAHRAQTFANIAAITLAELRQQMDLGHGKSVYNTHITCIERYFLPYIGERQLELLTHTDIVEFELWRNRQMNRTPKSSTLMNFSSTWNTS
jgi:integrase